MSEPESNPPDRLENVSLVHRQHELIKSLPSFKKKTHTVPDQINSHTQSFVAKLAAATVTEDLDQVFSNLRAAFRFKRTEIESTDWEDGSGSITTPYFRYVSAVTQNPDAPDEVVWQRDVSLISDVEQILTDEFVTAFGQLFDTVEFTPNDPIDLEQIVDRIEAIEDDRVWIEYDRQLTFCEVTLEGCTERIRITRESFRIVHPQAESPRVLVDSLFRVQHRLLGYDEKS